MHSHSCLKAVCCVQMVLFLWASWASALVCAHRIMAFTSGVVVAVTALSCRTVTRIEQARAAQCCAHAVPCHQPAP